MRTLTTSERTVRVAAAQVDPATRMPRSTRVAVAGRWVRLEFARLPAPGHGHKPQLRFDRVVVRVLHDVQHSLRPVVPPGVAVVFTLTAPIRLASKTTTALEHIARTLAAGSRGRDEVRRTLHGNQIRVRREELRGSESAVIGFVHNVATRPRSLFDVTRALLTVLWTTGRRRRATRSEERWLVLLKADSAYLEAYRSIYRQLDGPFGFARVLLVGDDGSVESVA